MGYEPNNPFSAYLKKKSPFLNPGFVSILVYFPPGFLQVLGSLS
jgi:hypothetical protein